MDTAPIYYDTPESTSAYGICEINERQGLYLGNASFRLFLSNLNLLIELEYYSFCTLLNVSNRDAQTRCVMVCGFHHGADPVLLIKASLVVVDLENSAAPCASQAEIRQKGKSPAKAQSWTLDAGTKVCEKACEEQGDM